jgi:hypothetical protein
MLPNFQSRLQPSRPFVAAVRPAFEAPLAGELVCAQVAPFASRRIGVGPFDFYGHEMPLALLLNLLLQLLNLAAQSSFLLGRVLEDFLAVTMFTHQLLLRR